METQNNNSHEHKGKVCTLGADMCGCNAGCGEHHKHMMKLFIKIALLVILFSFAYQMGELKGMLRSEYMHSNYGTRMMDRTYGNGAPHVYGGQMEIMPSTLTEPLQ